FLRWQMSSGLDMIQALTRVTEIDGLTSRAKNSLARLGETLTVLVGNFDDPSALVEQLLERSGYLDYIRDGSPQAEDREANISSLVSDAKSFSSLPDFLEEVALMTSADEVEDE